ncbi:hypothetical protein QQF64_012903 [Cirrhinus molitorella]|uniref:Uncharacterized protein n=1 Tax=Cirrhinus molitorella TaxID=172907 RepID=A0ABR3LPP3_9TELE
MLENVMLIKLNANVLHFQKSSEGAAPAGSVVTSPRVRLRCARGPGFLPQCISPSVTGGNYTPLWTRERAAQNGVKTRRISGSRSHGVSLMLGDLIAEASDGLRTSTYE